MSKCNTCNDKKLGNDIEEAFCADCNDDCVPRVHNTMIEIDILDAGLKACNHYAEAYPDEFTPELYEFIKLIERYKESL
jgi:hypothetical protein